MQTERQEFIRNPRRKHSPKFKLQNAQSSQCSHKIQRAKNDEYPIRCEENQEPRATDIVSDLKHQLSFLREQIAKISNEKSQKQNKKQNQINQSNRGEQYYFPNMKNSTQKSPQRQIKITVSLHNNSQQKIQSLKFKKLKNLQKRIKSAKSAQKLLQSDKKTDILKTQNKTDGIQNFTELFKKAKNKVSENYEKRINQLSTQMFNQRQGVYDKQSEVKINERIAEQDLTSKDSQISKNIKTAYELKSLKMKKTIKDSSLQIQNLNQKIKQQKKVIDQQNQKNIKHIQIIWQHNQKQKRQLSLIQMLQRELNISKMRIISLQNVQRQIASKLQNAKSLCKCKQLEKIIKEKQQNILGLQQKLEKQQALYYNKQLQTLKLQRTIINLQKQKYSKLQYQKYQKQKANFKEGIPQKSKNQKIQKDGNNELKQVIKIQQKSLINLQSDLRYLQSQLARFSGIKTLLKKQTNLIEDLNQKICVLQSARLNLKYMT